MKTDAFLVEFRVCNLSKELISDQTLYILCYFKSDKKHFARFSTGLKINSEEWTESSKSPTVEFALLNREWFATLQKKLAEIRTAFHEAYKSLGDKITAQTVTDLLEGQKGQVSQQTKANIKTLHSFIQWYIDKQNDIPYDKRKAEGTIRQYRKVRNKIEDYYKATKRQIYLATVSMDDINAFVAWFERQKHSSGKKNSFLTQLYSNVSMALDDRK